MEYILSLLFFLVLVIVMHALGCRVLSLAGFNFKSRIEKGTFAFALGFGLISYSILILGIFHLLYRSMFLIMLVALVFMLTPEIKESAINFLKTVKKQSFNKYTVILSAISLLLLLAALAPSYSNDSMVYHLTDAKYFARNNFVGLIPSNSANALWPYLVEMHFTLAILFKMLPMAGVAHCSLSIATMFAVYAFSKRFFKEKLAFLAAVIFLLVPGIFMEAAQTYVDLGAVFYTFMAVYAFMVWRDNLEIRWITLSGIMCGLAMSVKYFSIVVPFILSLYLIYKILNRKDHLNPEVFKPLLFMVSTAASCGIWYIRQYIVMGNPFFPFFSRIFGNSGLDLEVIKSISEEGIRQSLGLGANLSSFITLPWKLTMSPLRFGGEQLGPIFLAIVPAVFLIKGVDKKIKFILLFIFSYFCLWFFGYQNLRFLLPAVPFLSIVAAYAIIKFTQTEGLSSRFIWTGVSACLIFNFGSLIYKSIEPIKVVTGVKDEAVYLAENERSFAVSRFINNKLPENANLLVVNEGHTFFIDRPNKRELFYWIYGNYEKKYATPEEVLRFFKKEGFTHILIAQGNKIEQEAELRLGSILKDEFFVKNYLIEIVKIKPESKNASGITYIIYEIIS